MIKEQIKLLYCHYGWSIKDIATTLELPTSAIKMYIEEMGLIKNDSSVELITTPENGALPVAYTNDLRSLKTGEVSKQLAIAPIIAIIELTLLQKVREAADSVDPANIKSLSEVVNTFKRLKEDSIINTIMQSDKSAGGNGPQVAVQVMVHRD